MFEPQTLPTRTSESGAARRGAASAGIHHGANEESDFGRGVADQIDAERFWRGRQLKDRRQPLGDFVEPSHSAFEPLCP